MSPSALRLDNLQRFAYFVPSIPGELTWLHPSLFCYQKFLECREILHLYTLALFPASPAAVCVLLSYSLSRAPHFSISTGRASTIYNTYFIPNGCDSLAYAAITIGLSINCQPPCSKYIRDKTYFNMGSGMRKPHFYLRKENVT